MTLTPYIWRIVPRCSALDVQQLWLICAYARGYMFDSVSGRGIWVGSSAAGENHCPRNILLTVSGHNVIALTELILQRMGHLFHEQIYEQIIASLLLMQN